MTLFLRLRFLSTRSFAGRPQHSLPHFAILNGVLSRGKIRRDLYEISHRHVCRLEPRTHVEPGKLRIRLESATPPCSVQGDVALRLPPHSNAGCACKRSEMAMRGELVDQFHLIPAHQSTRRVRSPRDDTSRAPLCSRAASRFQRPATCLGLRGKDCCYFPKTFFTSPAFFCTFPAVFSAAPRASTSRFPVIWPVSSLILPFASRRPPLSLSFELESMHCESADTSAQDVSSACSNRRVRKTPGTVSFLEFYLNLIFRWARFTRELLRESARVACRRQWRCG